MATLTPTLTLKSTDALTDSLELTVTDSLSVLGQSKRFTKVLATTATDILLAGDYTKSYVYLHNKATAATDTVTIGKKSTVGGASYNDDPTIDLDSTANISFGMTVSGTGVSGTVASITDTNTFELSEATTTGSKSGQTLTFTMEDFMILGAGEFAFFPWDSTQDLEATAGANTPTLEIMIFQAAAD